MSVLRWRWALLDIWDPAMQCRLFDTLLLPILSSACLRIQKCVTEVAEVLHKGCLMHLLDVGMSAATPYLQNLAVFHYISVIGSTFCFIITE